MVGRGVPARRRSTCAARDWRAAWGVVGTDHTGDATPGEVYLLAVARRASATAAALHHWRELRERVVPLGKGNVSWQRIKDIAAWESSARAQADEAAAHRERMRIRHSFSGMKVMVGGRELARQARLYGRDNAGDEVLNALRQMERATAAQNSNVRPTNMWIDEATLDALRQQAAVIDDPVEPDPELYGNGRGVVGVLNNPFLTAAAQRGEITGTVTIPPRASATIAAALERYASLTGNAMNVQADASGRIVVTPRNTNPAPRGPQTRKRR